MTESSLPDSMDPGRFVEKVSLLTGDVQRDPIEPSQLLVSGHRDYHVLDVQARVVMSLLVDATGDEDVVRGAMKQVRKLGAKASNLFSRVAGERLTNQLGKVLFGFKTKEYYFRFKRHTVPPHEIYGRIERLQDAAAEKLKAVRDGERLRLRVLLTGGTGFVGKEFLWQVADDEDVAEVVVVVRPKLIRDRKTKEVVETIAPAQRGELLLDQLRLTDPAQRAKFRFVAGDVEQPNLGIADAELEELRRTITHVVHSAASVSFDDPYEKSFNANVLGTLNALAFSLELQNTPGSPFVAHLGIETSYIHGRQVRERAREDEIVFPRNFYNNYYELTKAMASIETERFMLGEGLRVVQLCPAIVIGESRAGNNRGDAKVVNAPVNVFGRAQQALTDERQDWTEWSKGWVIAQMATVFPGDPSAELNLVPVDRVVQGMVAALKKPRAVGERIHLATDNRITSQQIRDIVEEEIGVHVKLAEPTLHRNVTLPVLSRLLASAGQERLARGLDKLGTIFGGYSEWGQPIHEVGKDTKVLNLPEPRPNTEHAFRMLCRHNRYVQEFGKIRDDDEISRREGVWSELCEEIAEVCGRVPGIIPADRFHREVAKRLDLETFTLREKR